MSRSRVTMLTLAQSVHAPVEVRAGRYTLLPGQHGQLFAIGDARSPLLYANSASQPRMRARTLPETPGTVPPARARTLHLSDAQSHAQS